MSPEAIPRGSAGERLAAARHLELDADDYQVVVAGVLDRMTGRRRREQHLWQNEIGSAAVLGTPIQGSAAQIADGLRAFGAAGFTNLELVVWPPTLAAADAMACWSCSTPTDRELGIASGNVS